MNHNNSLRTVFHETNLVVSNGKDEAQSYSQRTPKTDRTVPLRVTLVEPWSRTWATRSRYSFISCRDGRFYI